MEPTERVSLRLDAAFPQAREHAVRPGVTRLSRLGCEVAPVERHRGEVEEPPPKSDYRILVRRGWEQTQAARPTLSVRNPLPEVQVPLRRDEPPARLAIGELLPAIYDRARYNLRLDYRQPPDPPLSSEDAAWAEELLSAAGLRD